MDRQWIREQWNFDYDPRVKEQYSNEIARALADGLQRIAVSILTVSYTLNEIYDCAAMIADNLEPRIKKNQR
jgi:hypothetical protein